MTLLLAALALAQPARPSLADVAPVDRRAADFYGAVAGAGPAVQVEWTLAPASVPLDGDTTLTLTVRNAANPHELTRPDLRDLPAFAERFQVSDEPAPPAAPDAPEVRFAYRLRPRATGEFDVPSLKYRYYRPAFPEGRRMQTTYARPVRLTVTAPPPPPAPLAVPLDAPDTFFQLTGDRTAFPPPEWAWAVPFALVPFTVSGWVLGWRAVFPDAATRAKRVRSRAARVALARLKRDDPAAVVHDYLCARFGMDPVARTPLEVAAGLPASVAPSAEAFFRLVDEARFAPDGDNGASLAANAAARIAAWEDLAP